LRCDPAGAADPRLAVAGRRHGAGSRRAAAHAGLRRNVLRPFSLTSPQRPSNRTHADEVPMNRHGSLCLLPVLASFALAGARPALAQETPPQTIEACYVPATGTVYRIKAPGLPTACLSSSHVAFSWNLAGPAGPAGEPGPEGPAAP